MSVDDYIDRYLIRMSETGRQPTSKQWLRWFLEDDAASNERVRAAQYDEPLYREDGTPTSWPRSLGS